ncbi:hypothetical protein F5882DRAFT_385278 [Hyaloscypha sp. PMI_1271]|nr:hypothetical protein F5882DRAFT_385278 [Hyaloscypha sp. PMI_1271]
MEFNETEIPASDVEILQSIKKDSFLVILFGITGVDTKAIDFHHLDYRNESFIFIDTPGFEDSVNQNSDILQMIADFLATSYEHNRYPDAVIYAFKITETRFMKNARKNSELFEELCGPGGMRLVTLLTTMWDVAGEVHPNTKAAFEAREESFIQGYWRDMIRSGAETCRSWNTKDSLLPILDQAIARRAARKREGQKPHGLQIQEEIIRKKRSLVETRAGSLLAEEFRIKAEFLEKQRQRLSKNLEKDPSNERLVGRLATVQEEIRDNEEGAEKLKGWTWRGIGATVVAAFMLIIAILANSE